MVPQGTDHNRFPLLSELHLVVSKHHLLHSDGEFGLSPLIRRPNYLPLGRERNYRFGVLIWFGFSQLV